MGWTPFARQQALKARQRYGTNPTLRELGAQLPRATAPVEQPPREVPALLKWFPRNRGEEK